MYHRWYYIPRNGITRRARDESQGRGLFACPRAQTLPTEWGPWANTSTGVTVTFGPQKFLVGVVSTMTCAMLGRAHTTSLLVRLLEGRRTCHIAVTDRAPYRTVDITSTFSSCIGHYPPTAFFVPSGGLLYPRPPLHRTPTTSIRSETSNFVSHHSDSESADRNRPIGTHRH